jgi:hypothetical protein
VTARLAQRQFAPRAASGVPSSRASRVVEEGRIVYRNLKKIVLYLLSTSLAEVVVLLAALVILVAARAGRPPHRSGSAAS